VLLGNDGQAVQSCDGAVVFSLTNNSLFANSTNQALQFGTNSGVQYAEFLPSTNPGTITGSFYVDAENNLRWKNAAFYDGQARFCVNTDGKLLAVFDDPLMAPHGCLFVALTLSGLGVCRNGITGPSGPPGV
jgi:hypothetical protein